VNKRIAVDLLKYALAFGLLAWVVGQNWGDPRGTAGKIVVGGTPAAGEVSGRVVAYASGAGEKEPPRWLTFVWPFARKPHGSITVEDAAGERSEFALKSGGGTQVVGPDDRPLPAGEPLPAGTPVVVSEVSRGLAYVWRRHAIEGEPIHAGFLALAFLAGLTGVTITFLRWYVLVRAVDLPFRVPDALRLGFIGFFFNTFLPGSVGGDIIKAAFLAREQKRRTVAVATVIMDRAIALWALVWFVALLGAAFWGLGLLVGQGAPQCRTVVKAALAIIGASLLVCVLLWLLPAHRAERFAGRLGRLPKVGHPAAEFWRAVWMYRCRPRSVLAVLALSWVGQVFFVLLFYCSVRTLWDPNSGQEIPSLLQHFLLVPIGLVIQAMPLFPGGAGIGELGFGKLYQWVGCSEASGVLGSLVQRVVNWVLGLFGYVVYRRMRPALRPPAEEPAALAAAGV
jgi:uncharacterized membrane protein YbhN (UPF0104 family)